MNNEYLHRKSLNTKFRIPVKGLNMLASLGFIAEKACKITTKKWHVQIFSKKNADVGAFCK